MKPGIHNRNVRAQFNTKSIPHPVIIITAKGGQNNATIDAKHQSSSRRITLKHIFDDDDDDDDK